MAMAMGDTAIPAVVQRNVAQLEGAVTNLQHQLRSLISSDAHESIALLSPVDRASYFLALSKALSTLFCCKFVALVANSFRSSFPYSKTAYDLVSGVFSGYRVYRSFDVCRGRVSVCIRWIFGEKVCEGSLVWIQMSYLVGHSETCLELEIRK